MDINVGGYKVDRCRDAHLSGMTGRASRSWLPQAITGIYDVQPRGPVCATVLPLLSTALPGESLSIDCAETLLLVVLSDTSI